ncbi:unnamed protein product [Cylindrotheca closterium]|uniref:Ubiquitin-activating enzyme E1 C-terminal domain-containing protein n=1 Tax=Cylindrotheca closterium TaxID=2856 RepID=A0AAD2GE81_9STRA|nr:unnamed protein product [Cylindrotheca closterium]
MLIDLDDTNQEMNLHDSILILFVLNGLISFVSSEGWGIEALKGSHATANFRNLQQPLSLLVRGGAEDDNDEERYSRQVYTLGARAHGMVRSSTVYVDGPSDSGLLYECVKNLALSGVGKIVLVTSDETMDAAYHSTDMDDLGRTYISGARAELGLSGHGSSVSSDSIFVEFLRRLNPSLHVGSVARSELQEISGGRSDILLCVDRPYSTQVSLNEVARKSSFSFVAVETAGVYGRTFCDFGNCFEIHDIDGETPLSIPLDRVERIDGVEKKMKVRCISGERHDVSRGDVVSFLLEGGEALDVTCKVVQVYNPELVSVEFDVDDDEIDSIVVRLNEAGRSFSRIKQLQEVSFVPLQEAINDQSGSLFTPCDLDKSFDESRRMGIFNSFQALNTFVKENDRLPRKLDWNEFYGIVKGATASSEDVKEWKRHCKQFMRTCAGKFTPIQAIFGAVAAQECLKAASGLYNPIRQFLIYDCDEVLPPTKKKQMEETCSSGLEYILGSKVGDAVKNQNLFVVGAGAIGCEILKNLAAMDAGTGSKGSIIVTDMDTIEKSNLSRQLLFRDMDIGKFKSQAAKEAVRRLNDGVKIECHTSKVGDGEESTPFDDEFWSKKVGVVMNALDNVEARLFMDGQCVANEKPLVDAGTLGSKGNVQVVVPHQSESYGSSADPPEPAIPVCTLKNFPYQISHTIQWGRDLFDGLFVRRPKQANQYASLYSELGWEEIAERLESELGEAAAIDAAKELRQDLAKPNGNDNVSLKEASIVWAIELANDLFYDVTKKLLAQHPEDSVDEDGEPFWSGSRKTPKLIWFSSENESESQQSLVNENYADFVHHAARLRLEALVEDPASVKDCLITKEDAVEALRKYSLRDPDARSEAESPQVQIRRRLESLGDNVWSERPQNVAEFEKDDDSNGHIAFITAASNLRAMCYGIAPADAMETRRIAGKIVPAMITTTALVSALSCIEMVKVVQGLPLQRYRNAFINLALPFFAFTAPLPTEELPGLRGSTYTMWDRLTVKEGKKTAERGGITVRQFLKRLKKKASDNPDELDISTVTFGEFMIYANFLNEDDDDLLDKKLWDVVQGALESAAEFEKEYSRDGGDESKATTVEAARFLDFTVAVEDLENGEEVELPPVRVIRS